jgi:hypothetical protein
MIDIRDYPGAINALNQILNSGKEAALHVEDNGVAVAEHARFWCGTYEAGAEERKPKAPRPANR